MYSSGYIQGDSTCRLQPCFYYINNKYSKNSKNVWFTIFFLFRNIQISKITCKLHIIYMYMFSFKVLKSTP